MQPQTRVGSGSDTIQCFENRPYTLIYVADSRSKGGRKVAWPGVTHDS